MESASSIQLKDDMLSFEGFRSTVLEDYRTAVVSREVSFIRKEGSAYGES